MVVETNNCFQVVIRVLFKTETLKIQKIIMLRFLFYTATALLTFAIGSIIGFEFYGQTNQQLATVKNPLIAKVNNQLSFEPVRNLTSKQSEPFYLEQRKLEKRFCYDKQIVPVWNELKKDGYFRGQGSYEESGNCTDMLEVRAIDLNKDGRKEILLRGKNTNLCGATGNCGFWIFERKDGKYRKLLSSSDYIDITEMPNQIEKSMTRGYFDILLKGHITAADTDYNYYKFDGREYKQTKCLVNMYVRGSNTNGENAKWEFVSCRKLYKLWKLEN